MDQSTNSIIQYFKSIQKLSQAPREEMHALWKRAYSKAAEWLAAVVYEDPWLAGGHNGLSNAEDPLKPEDPYPRVKALREGRATQASASWVASYSPAPRTADRTANAPSPAVATVSGSARR